jgi:hypothetical protein
VPLQGIQRELNKAVFFVLCRRRVFSTLFFEELGVKEGTI